MGVAGANRQAKKIMSGKHRVSQQTRAAGIHNRSDKSPKPIYIGPRTRPIRQLPPARSPPIVAPMKREDRQLSNDPGKISQDPQVLIAHFRVPGESAPLPKVLAHRIGRTGPEFDREVDATVRHAPCSDPGIFGETSFLKTVGRASGGGA